MQNVRVARIEKDRTGQPRTSPAPAIDDDGPIRLGIEFRQTRGQFIVRNVHRTGNMSGTELGSRANVEDQGSCGRARLEFLLRKLPDFRRICRLATHGQERNSAKRQRPSE